MTRRKLFIVVKSQLRTWAKELKRLKGTRKQDKRDGRELFDIICDIAHIKYMFRHHHISYCEMRGRTRDEIERPKEFNKASQREIDRIQSEWMEKLDEDVRSCAA